MNDRSLLRWGGICAFSSVIVLAIIDVTSKVTGGIEWTAFIPVFSIFICLYVIVLLAAYDYLAKTHYGPARIGFAFGLLLIVVLFVEVAALGADQMALFASTHTLAIWFHALWMAFWGAAFVRLPGKAKVTGALMLLFTGLYSISYLMHRLGDAALANLAHDLGHVPLLISHWLLGSLLLKASKEAV